MMTIKLNDTLKVIVEAMLPRFTPDKILHFCIDVRYTYNVPFEKDRLRQEQSPSPEPQQELSDDEMEAQYFNDLENSVIGSSFYLHFIIHRERGYTRVLWMKNQSAYLYNQDGPHIFEQCGYHDSEWKSGIEEVINQLHRDGRQQLEDEYLKRTGEKLPLTESLRQPRCWFGFCGDRGINLLDGSVVMIDHEDYHGKFDLKIKNKNQGDDQPRTEIWTLTQLSKED